MILLTIKTADLNSGIVIKFFLIFAAIIFILIAAIFFDLSAGHGGTDLFAAINGNEYLRNVFWQIRFPRVLTAALVGAFLAVSGVVYQSIFQNPLVSPDLLGASSGAAAGAALTILLGFSWTMVPPIAFLAGILALGISVTAAVLVGRHKSFSPLILILSGLMVSSLLSSILALCRYFLPDEGTMRSISYFLMGSLSGSGWNEVIMLVSFGLPLLILIFIFSRTLDLMALPYDVLITQGIHIHLVVIVFLLLATALSGVAVSAVGIIGWISLIVPGVMRILVGEKNRILIPFSACIGSSVLLITDGASRAFIQDIEIPTGIITGIIGAPLFLFLIWHSLSIHKNGA